MGSIITAIRDDYDDYKSFCELIGKDPVYIFDEFYVHRDKILKQIGFKTIHDFYDMLIKAENRDEKIRQILDDSVGM